MCVIAGIAGAVGSVASGVIGASGAQSAANTQAQAAQNAQNISLGEFNTITGQEQPYMQGGYGALGQLNYLLGNTPQTAQGGATTGMSASGPGAQVTAGQSPYLGGILNNTSVAPQSGYPAVAQGSGGASGARAGTGVAGSTAGGFGSLLAPFTADTMKQYSPAYQFQMQQGQQGVLNQDASSQGALSGAALKDLIGYNQNYANTAFNNAFNQYQTQQGNVYSRLMGVAQLGQNAASNTGAQGTALAGQAAQSATNVGTAQAAGTVGAANAYSGSIGSSLPYLLAMQGGGGTGITQAGLSAAQMGAATNILDTIGSVPPITGY